MIYICYSYLSEAGHESLMRNELPKFPFYFMEKIKKCRRWQDAQLSLLGRILLFRAIREKYNVTLEEKDMRYNICGKPFFKDNPIRFSISHSGEIVICALSNEDSVGIDIEELTQANIVNFKNYMLDSEWSRIASSEEKCEAFFDYWTQKEAVLKNLGLGQIDLKSFEISNGSTRIGNEKFYLKEIRIDSKYRCSISHKIERMEYALARIAQ